VTQLAADHESLIDSHWITRVRFRKPAQNMSRQQYRWIRA